MLRFTKREFLWGWERELREFSRIYLCGSLCLLGVPLCNKQKLHREPQRWHGARCGITSLKFAEFAEFAVEKEGIERELR